MRKAGEDADASYVMVIDFFAREYHWTEEEIASKDNVFIALLGKAIEFRRKGEELASKRRVK
jgi:hypothetical protein